MAPSWSEFWGRIGEVFSTIGEVIEVLKVPDLILMGLALIVPFAICLAGTFMLFRVRRDIRDEARSPTGNYYFLASQRLVIALTYLGQVTLMLAYVVFNYGFWGTFESVLKSGFVAVAIPLAFAYAYYVKD